jgi:hypothetical protein
MKCTCGHTAHYHLNGHGRCIVNAAASASDLDLPCRCLVYVSRASYAAALPIRGLDWLLRKAIR